MNGRLMAVMVAGAALMSRSSGAQEQVSYGVAVGTASPTGAFRETVDAGYHLAGMAFISSPHMPLGMRVDVSASSYPLKNAGNYWILSGTGSVTASPVRAMAVKPYVMGGFGIYQLFFDYNRVIARETCPGLAGGVGAKFTVGKLTPFIEAREHFVLVKSGPSHNFVPITVGLIF